MGKPTTDGWNREVFAELVEKSSISRKSLAAASGVSEAAINQYIRGVTAPGYANILKIADFFAVPLDLLAGRCDEETARGVLDNYGAYFMRLRRAPYEAYLRCRRPTQAIHGFEAPWPYNLLDEIFQGQWSDVLTQDQLDGLKKALTILTEREQQVIDAYYRRGLNLEEAGREQNVTRERLRQISAKAVRKLRHPARKKLILYGLEMSKEMSEVGRLRAELTAETYALTQWQAELDARAELLGYRERKQIGTPEFDDEAGSSEQDQASHGLQNIWIDELQLSVRSYNCLRRACIDTVADILELSQEDMIHVRNLGRKSMEEIIRKMHSMGLKMSWEV